jgi:cbb3-type cytochrome c oxidase subunit II
MAHVCSFRESVFAEAGSSMRDDVVGGGWRGVVLIAAVYIYFLIFAQFAFLARLAEFGIAGNALNLVMAAMASGGILLSLLTPRISAMQSPALRLRLGLALSASAALLTLAPLQGIMATIVAFLIGAGMGITTVTLVTHLRIWTGSRRGIVHVGLGTGIAYFICNVPAVFTANAKSQAVLAAAICAVAIVLPLAPLDNTESETSTSGSRISFAVALLSFAALIWLDSAAFYIIQHTALLKAGTWLGSTHLWVNGSLHFCAAVAAALLLQTGRTSAALALAFTGLGFACLLLQHPGLVLSASLFYPVGVSLYSVALVAYPSFLAQADSTRERGRQAGWIYAIAGWIGSALGIGMGQNLGHVPSAFVALAGAVALAPLCLRLARLCPREIALLAAVSAIAFLLYRFIPTAQTLAALTAAQRGRQVYISEGCISCHSQYVRPNSPDTLMWGPVESMQDIHAQKPPLIGNRRQGPDLAEVGLRRSPLWLKAHLVSPAEVSYSSPMPLFAILFRDSRGDDLVAYLSSLHGPGQQLQLQDQAAWSPSPSASADPEDGERVYHQHCATCHDANGATRLHWLNDWRKIPPTLAELRAFAINQPESKLAQIAKFGMPGTDMPGHEYLRDRDIASVARWMKLASR